MMGVPSHISVKYSNVLVHNVHYPVAPVSVGIKILVIGLLSQYFPQNENVFVVIYDDGGWGGEVGVVGLKECLNYACVEMNAKFLSF